MVSAAVTTPAVTTPAAASLAPTTGRPRRPRALLRRLTLTGICVALATAASTLAGVGSASAAGLCDLLGPVSRTACGIAGGAVESAGGAVVGGTFDKIVNNLLSGYQTMIEWALAWWIKLPTPRFDADSGLMSDLHEHTLQLQLFGMTFSMIFFGLRMITDRKRSLADDAEEGFKIVLRAGLATSAIPMMLTLGGVLTDNLSNWLISEAIGADRRGDMIRNFLKLNVLTGSNIGTTAIGLFALVGFLGALLQLILLVVRQCMLVLVVGVLPIAASFSGTGPGSQSYQRLVTWSVAFLLFKPVGALVYFIAFRGASQNANTNAQQVLLGMVLMGMVAFVLPSLLRLIAPAVSSQGSGGSGAQAAGMAVGAAVTAGTMAATAGAGGAGAAGAAGGSGGMSSMASRSGSAPAGSMTSASSPPPAAPQSGGGAAGAQPALSGGDPGRTTSSSSGGGPTSASGGGMQAAENAGAALGSATSVLEREVDTAAGAGDDMGPPPPTQSGYGEHHMPH